MAAKAASTLTITVAGASPGSATVTGAGPGATYTTDLRLNLANAKPAPATLAAPANGASGLPDTPALSWNGTAQTSFYRLQIDTEPTFTDPLYDLTLLRAPSFTPSEPLAAGATYYWRVGAANGCGSAATGAVASFRVRDVARTLLVDDSSDPADARASYSTALDALGKTYDVWRGTSADDGPSLAKLRNYRTVLWTDGYDINDVPSPASQERLRVAPTPSAAASFRINATISAAGVEIDTGDQAMAVAVSARAPSLSFVGPQALQVG